MFPNEDLFEEQEALVSQRGRAMFRALLWLVSTVHYLKRSLLLLVTSASDLPVHTIKLLCSLRRIRHIRTGLLS